MLGVVGGRVAWSLFIRNVGINAAPVVPWTGLAVLIVASLAIAVGFATILALLASRTHPGTCAPGPVAGEPGSLS